MKVIVYAIAKNEEKNVSQWYESMKEADEIYVLDTGSTDKTIEMLKNYPKVVLNQAIINPWRFDEARNKSLDLVPQEVDICVCTDIDERFQPGWRKKLENAWNKDTTRAKYNYNWSHNTDGTPGLSFYLNKIHCRNGYKWIHQVHEVLVPMIPEKEVMVDITLDHYADLEKSRGMYLEILERAVNENLNDARDVYCLGREYKAHYRYDDAIKTFHNFLKLETATWNQERSAAMRYIGDCYKAKGYIEEAILWLSYAIEETPNIREVYYDLGSLYLSINDFENARINLTKALNITIKNPDYINEKNAWDGSIYHLIAIAEYHTGHYESSYDHITKAIKINPNSEDIKNNFKMIEKTYKETNE